MSDKEQRRIAATELRVNLGAALRELEDVDLVIEKGGVPVAVLRRYEPPGRAAVEAAEGRAQMVDTKYDRALAWRADPAAWDRAMRLVGRGWVGDDDALTADAIRAGRDAGVSDRSFELDEPEEESDHAGRVPPRQRRLHQGPVETRRVADEPLERLSPRRPRD